VSGSDVRVDAPEQSLLCAASPAGAEHDQVVGAALELLDQGGARRACSLHGMYQHLVRNALARLRRLQKPTRPGSRAISVALSPAG
jgi:hypothetical protein